MVKVILDEHYITFEIKNDNIGNDLKRFYNTEYFEFIGLNPEIFLTPHSIVGGGSSDYHNLTVPYKYFVKFVDGDYNILIKNIKMPEVFIPVKDYLKNILNKEEQIDYNGKDKDKGNSNGEESRNDAEEDTKGSSDDADKDKDNNNEEESRNDGEVSRNDGEESRNDGEESRNDGEEDTKESLDDADKDVDNGEESRNNAEIDAKGDVEEDTSEDFEKDAKEDTGEDAEEGGEEDRNETEEGDKRETFEVITIKVRLNHDENVSDAHSLPEILKMNKEFIKDNIEMNSDGLTYHDIESILKIKKYLEERHYESKIVFYQEEIFRINGKYIVIKDNESVAGTSIDKIDVSNLENTFLMKLYL